MREQTIEWFNPNEQLPVTHKEIIFFTHTKEEYKIGHYVKLIADDSYFVEESYTSSEYNQSDVKEWAYLD